MVEVYDAHEQGEIVKKWLTENGSAIVMGLVIAFGGLFGVKQWQVWQESNRQQACEGRQQTWYLGSTFLRFGGGANELQRSIIASRHLGMAR